MASQYDSVWVPTLTGAFLTSYEGVLNKQWANPIMRMYSVKGEFLKPIDLGSVGAVRQFSGPRHVTKPNPYILTQQNLTYELTMGIDIEDVDRDNLGMFDAKAAEMGGKFADHPTKLLVALLKANPTSFDGTAFFGTHANNGNQIINDVTVTQIPALAAAIAAAPTPVEMAAIITGIFGYFYAFVDEAGDPINGDAREFLFVTSNPAVYAAINAVIFSDQLSQGQTNQVKAGWEIKGWKLDLALEPRLGTTASTVFYFFRKDSVVKPFIWGEEKALQIVRLGEGSDMAVINNKYVWGAKAVRSIGPGRWQHSLRLTLS